MNKLNKKICIVGLSVLAIACSHTEKRVNPIISHAENTKELGQQWSEGHELVEKGNKLIVKGKEQIEEGEENLERGRDLVEQGESKMAESEAEFESLLYKNPAAQ